MVVVHLKNKYKDFSNCNFYNSSFTFQEKHKIEEENMKLKLKIERAIEHRPILLQTATSLNNLIKVVSKIIHPLPYNCINIHPKIVL